MLLSRLVEKTFFDNCRYWGSFCSPVYSRGEVWAMKTGVESADLNMAWNEKPLTATDLAAVREVKEYYCRAGLPFWWWVFPCGWSKETVEMLRSEGFSPTDKFPTLLADLSRLPDSKLFRADISVVSVQNKAQMALWEEVSFAGFEFQPEPREQYSRFVQSFSLEQDAPQKFFLAFINQKPVATSLFFLSGPMAGIYFVATLPDQRKKGIGLHLTQRTLHHAKMARKRFATLQSTPEGLPVYLKAGFENFGHVDVYAWTP